MAGCLWLAGQRRELSLFLIPNLCSSTLCLCDLHFCFAGPLGCSLLFQMPDLIDVRSRAAARHLQVEEVKLVLRLLPVFAATVVYWTIYAQASSTAGEATASPAWPLDARPCFAAG